MVIIQKSFAKPSEEGTQKSWIELAWHPAAKRELVSHVCTADGGRHWGRYYSYAEGDFETVWQEAYLRFWDRSVAEYGLTPDPRFRPDWAQLLRYVPGLTLEQVGDLADWALALHEGDLPWEFRFVQAASAKALIVTVNPKSGLLSYRQIS